MTPLRFLKTAPNVFIEMHSLSQIKCERPESQCINLSLQSLITLISFLQLTACKTYFASHFVFRNNSTLITLGINKTILSEQHAFNYFLCLLIYDKRPKKKKRLPLLLGRFCFGGLELDSMKQSTMFLFRNDLLVYRKNKGGVKNEKHLQRNF